MTPQLPAGALLLGALLLLMVVGLLACAADPPDSSPLATMEPTAKTQPVFSAPTAVPTLTLTETPIPSPIAADIPIPTTAGLLRLADNLDDPQGYCADVAGFGANIRLNAPMQAHTCKPGSDDQMFAPIAPADGGGIRLVEYDRCLTAETVGYGAEINVVGCDAGMVNQRFSLGEDGRVQLPLPDGPSLCLGIAAGQGERAGGRNHLRRDLLLYDCDEVDLSLIRWELTEQQ